MRNRYFIENKDQAQALAYFLKKEQLRHEQDIEKIRGDLTNLKFKWGIEEPKNVDVLDWWDI
jgi:hypothetical protein